jgi:hypothetical protein
MKKLTVFMQRWSLRQRDSADREDEERHVAVGSRNQNFWFIF